MEIIALTRSIAATATFFTTASLTTRFLHDTLEAIPGDSSLGAHGGMFLASGFAAVTAAFVAPRVVGATARARQVVAFCSAFAFALALRLSNLTNPRRVLAFLLTPAHTAFDPSLAYLAVGAIPLTSVLYRVGSVRVQRKGKVDARLLTGAAVFGVGWGIEGICRGSLPQLCILDHAEHHHLGHVAGPGLVNFGWALATGGKIWPLATWLAGVIVGGLLVPS